MRLRLGRVVRKVKGQLFRFREWLDDETVQIELTVRMEIWSRRFGAMAVTAAALLIVGNLVRFWLQHGG